MCGICGWISNSPKKSGIIQNITDTMRHRGPDSEGYWSNGVVSFGHRRLSIIDLISGQQPIISSKGNVIAFNGEIYNYKELREQLSDKGFIFRTSSDTEVLLNSYELWGEACLQKFIGMFSFAIWSPDKKELFMARDRLGKKPLFYYHSNSLFAFASEIKALLAIDDIRKSIDINAYAVSDYLSLGYILAPKTIFNKIYKIPAGYYALYSEVNKDLKLNNYWHIENNFVSEKNYAYKSGNYHEFVDLLSNSVNIRMRSDVPIGVYLSGGVDSAAVTALMSKFSEAKIKAFCIGFNEKSYDESGFAQLVTNSLDVDIEKLFYRNLSENDLSKLVWHLDEPFSDTSMMPTYQLNKLTKAFATVVLSGDGADEILAGYPTYRADSLYKIYSALPEGIHVLISRAINRILSPSYRKVSFDYKIKQFMRSYGCSREQAHYWWRVIFSEEEKKEIMSDALWEECKTYDPYEVFDNYYQQLPGADFLNKSLYVDLKTWLQDDILVKVDRMSMANSVEVRCPFLDHRLVEYCASLPLSAKMSSFQQKNILKKTMRKCLPNKILSRSKRGFNAPTYNNKYKYTTFLRNDDLFSDNFRLQPEKEDVTFKSFNFSILQKWIDIYEQYKLTGRWEPREYHE